MGEDTIYFSDLLSTLICWAMFLILIGGGVMGYLTRATPLGMPDIIQDLKDDKIQLGYIDDGIQEAVVVDEVQHLKQQVETLKLQRELNKLRAELNEDVQQDDKLFKDCVDSLVALGEKRSDARRMTAKIFKDNPEITIEEFIAKAYNS